MTAKERMNLTEWLKNQGVENEKIIECLESVEGSRSDRNESHG